MKIYLLMVQKSKRMLIDIAFVWKKATDKFEEKLQEKLIKYY